MLENIICAILVLIWVALIISMIVETKKKIKIRNERDDEFYRTIRGTEAYILNAYDSRIEQYLIENLYTQNHIKKIDPKELLLSKLKQK